MPGVTATMSVVVWSNGHVLRTFSRFDEVRMRFVKRLAELEVGCGHN